MEACVYSDNPEIKANLDQDYMQTDPYLKVEIIITIMLRMVGQLFIDIKWEKDTSWLRSWCSLGMLTWAAWFNPVSTISKPKYNDAFLPANVFTCFCRKISCQQMFSRLFARR